MNVPRAKCPEEDAEERRRLVLWIPLAYPGHKNSKVDSPKKPKNVRVETVDNRPLFYGTERYSKGLFVCCHVLQDELSDTGSIQAAYAWFVLQRR